MVLFPDPFGTLVDLQKALDVFRQSDWLQSSPCAGGSYPPLNIFRKGDGLALVAEVPGINRSDLEIQVRVARSVCQAPNRSNTQKTPAFIAVKGCRVASIVRSRCRLKSTRTASPPNAETAF